MSIALTIAGIAVPALLLVVAIRRCLAPVRWTFALLFLALTFAFLNGAVFTSRLPVPVDEVARGYPYRGVFGDVTARNPLTNDTVKLFLPWMLVAREELFHGRAPLWNRYAFSGYPLLANGESAPFSPFFLATLFVPLPKQIVAIAGLKIFVSLLFGYLFLKREQVSDAAAVFGSSAFAFSIFQTVFLYYSTTAVTALLPAALFALFFASDVAAKRGVVLTALVVASLMASGHPESVLHIAIVSFVLFAIDFALAGDRRAWLSRVRFPFAGAAAGLAISLPSWVPAAEQVLISTRYAQLRAAAAEPPFPWSAAWAIVAPNGFGNPVRHNWSWIRNYSTVAISYFGLIVTAAFIAAIVSRRLSLRHRLWALAAVVLFVVAMQWTFVGTAVTALPLMSVSANDKVRFAACFLAAAVAAKWLDTSRAAATFAPAALVLAALAGYVYWKHPSLSQPQDLVGAAAVVSVAIVMAVPRFEERAVVTAAILCVVELFVINEPFNSLVEQKYYRPNLPIIDALRRRAPQEPFRIAALDWAFLPNAAAQYGLEDVRGSDPMSYAQYTNFLSLVAIGEAGTDVLRVVDVRHAALDHLNVRFLITEPGSRVGGDWKHVYGGLDGELYENGRVLPRFYAPASVHTVRFGSIANVAAIADFRRTAIVRGRMERVDVNVATVRSVEARSPSEFALRVSAAAPALVVSSEPWSRWWVARANGERCRTTLVDASFTGIYVPSGESLVTLSYRPWTYYGSVAGTLVVAVGLAVWPRRRGGVRSVAPEMVE